MKAKNVKAKNFDSFQALKDYIFQVTNFYNQGNNLKNSFDNISLKIKPNIKFRLAKKQNQS